MDFRLNSICFILLCLLIADNQIDGRALEKPLREKRNIFDDLFDTDEEDSEGDNDAPIPWSEDDPELNNEEDGSPSPNPSARTYNEVEHDDETDLSDDGYSQSESGSENDDVTTQDYEDLSDDQNVPRGEDSDYPDESDDYKK